MRAHACTHTHRPTSTPPLAPPCLSLSHCGRYERYDALVKALSAKPAHQPLKKKRKNLTAETAPAAAADGRSAGRSPGRSAAKTETGPADLGASPKRAKRTVAAEAGAAATDVEEAPTPTPKKKVKANCVVTAEARTPSLASESKKGKRIIAQPDETALALDADVTPKRTAAAQKMYASPDHQRRLGR